MFRVQRPEAERITPCTPVFVKESAETNLTLPVTTGVPSGRTASTTKLATSLVVKVEAPEIKVAVVVSL